jgi:hypothetical protein
MAPLVSGAEAPLRSFRGHASARCKRTRDDLRQSHRRGEALGGRPGFDNKKQAALAAAL